MDPWDSREFIINEIGVSVHVFHCHLEEKIHVSRQLMAFKDLIEFRQAFLDLLQRGDLVVTEADHDDGLQTETRALAIEDRHIFVNDSRRLKASHTFKNGRWRKSDFMRQFGVGDSAVLLQNCQNLFIGCIKHQVIR